MNYLFIILLTCLAAFTRLAPHPPNFTPILSIALFCGVCFRSKYIFLVPLFAMLISDFILGFHSVIMYVYFSLLLIFIFGKLVSEKISYKSTLIISLFSSILFFLITNFGVWIIGYPKTFSGLILCYSAAIPFFKNSLISTLMFSSVFYYCYSYISNQSLAINKNWFYF